MRSPPPLPHPFISSPRVSPSYRIPPSVRLLPVTPYRRRMRRRAASAAPKEHKRLLSAIFDLFMFNASLGAFEHGVLGDLVPHSLIRGRHVVSSGINQKIEASPEEGWNINLTDWFTGERLEERPGCLLALHQRSACKSGTKRWGNWARIQRSGSGMRQERLPAAGRRPRAGVKQRQQSSGGVGNIISNVLKKRNGISRSAPRLLCTLEPGDLRAFGLILKSAGRAALTRDTCQNTTKCWAEIYIM